MRYLSVCSGIEAASAAWMPLGWRPVAFSEIEPFPTSVLAHHHPGVPNWGDMTKYKEWPDEPIDLLCGGTPCQSFSVAGLRKGLADPRGNLMLTFGAIAARYRPRWLVWENVPGVLSSNGGRDFGTFLGMLGQLGYGFAYRVLDAQYFGVAQRRRRVFVVGCLGDWRSAAAVLFERHSLQGHPAPRREAGQVAPTIPARSLGGGGLGTDFDCDGGVVQQPTFCIKGAAIGRKPEAGPQHGEILQELCYTQNCVDQHAVAYGIRTANTSSNGWGIQEEHTHTLDCAQGVAVAFSAKDYGGDAGSIAPTLRAMGHGDSHANGGGQVAVAVAVALRGREGGATAELGDEVQNCLRASSGGGDKPHVLTAMQVRRLTPEECEKLQGFEPGYTAIPWRGKPASECPDGPRYKSLGNSWAVPVARWIGERIEAVEAIAQQKVEAA